MKYLLEMCIAGAWAALFQHIEYKISSANLGKSCPSHRTLAWYKLHLAVDCLAKCIDEIKQDGADLVGVMMDHGHHTGQDHFVIVIILLGF